MNESNNTKSLIGLDAVEKNGVLVMSSVDLAKLCVGESKDAHSNFMKKALNVLGEQVVNFYEQQSYEKGNGAKGSRTILLLPEREACLMAMSYSYELQAFVFDEWQKLKNKAPQLPQSFAEALQLAADQAKALELAAPKVQFVNDFVEAKGSKTFREVAKMLGIKEPMFRSWMVANKIQYLLNGSWTAYQCHIDAGRFTVKTGEHNGHAYLTCRFTPKGIQWIAQLWQARAVC